MGEMAQKGNEGVLICLKKRMTHKVIRFLIEEGINKSLFTFFPHSGNRLKKFFGVSRTQETVSKNFLAFPALRKLSQKIFWHFPHSGNRLKKFFGISRTQEIVSKFFWHFPHSGNRLKKFFGISRT
jgi:biotin operon repressor